MSKKGVIDLCESDSNNWDDNRKPAAKRARTPLPTKVFIVRHDREPATQRILSLSQTELVSSSNSSEYSSADQQQRRRCSCVPERQNTTIVAVCYDYDDAVAETEDYVANEFDVVDDIETFKDIEWVGEGWFYSKPDAGNSFCNDRVHIEEHIVL
jgi:hypothetical protein